MSIYNKIQNAIMDTLDLISNGIEVNDAVIKSASGLPAQAVSRVVEGVNTARMLEVIESGKDKRATFPLADSSVVLSNIGIKEVEKSALFALDDIPDFSFFDDEYSEKKEKRSNNNDSGFDVFGNGIFIVDVEPAPYIDLYKLKCANDQMNNITKEAKVHFQDQLEENYSNLLSKIKISECNIDEAREFAQNAVAKYGKKDPMLLGLFKRAGYACGLDAVEPSILPDINDKNLVMFDKAKEAAYSLYILKEKEALFGTGRALSWIKDKFQNRSNNNSGNNNSGNNRNIESAVKKGLKGIKNISKPSIKNEPGFASTVIKKTLTDIINPKNWTTDDLGRSFGDAEKQALDYVNLLKQKDVIEDLMDNDEILSKQNPDDIVSAYQEIANVAPFVAANKGITRSLLRQYWSQGSISAFDALQLAKLNAQLANKEAIIYDR